MIPDSGALELSLAVGLAVAALAGLAVGVERERSGHASGPDARFAGARTFTLLGALGGIAGGLLARGQEAAGAALLGGAALLAVAAYVTAVRRPGATPDGTTETAALVVVALGALAGLGHLRLAAGTAVLVALVLAEKQRMHGLLARLDEHELRAALQFAALALVVLPILPDREIPQLGDANPRALWIIVLLFSGLNFLGYMARQAVGPERGYGVTGLLGGLVSSTAVTLHFSRQSRREAALAGSLGLGVLAACTVLLPRVIIVSAVLTPAVARHLVAVLAPPFVLGAGLVLAAVLRRQTVKAAATGDDAHSPLGLWSAIQMAVAFQVVLWLVAWAQRAGGEGGVLATAALLGLTDVDALTVAMNKLGRTPGQAGLAASAIGIGIISNTLLKLALTLTLGTPAFRRVASTGLLALTMAAAAGVWLAWG